MPVLLDTDTAIAVIRGRPASARARLRTVHERDEEVRFSSISLFELWYGVGHSRDIHENSERLMDFLAGPITVVEFDELDAARAGYLRAELAGVGTPIGPYDLLIAAQAARRGLVLATGNALEFGRVEDLVIENWLEPG
jgi:tRNA(fMet)-specific endonuclease VapC